VNNKNRSGLLVRCAVSLYIGQCVSRVHSKEDWQRKILKWNRDPMNADPKWQISRPNHGQEQAAD